MDAATAPDRKARGVYYTPPGLAKVLAEWALDPRPERILEPAFGDGVFMRAAFAALVNAGVPDPQSRLVGVEIDPDAPQRLRESGLELNPGQLHQSDLLALDAKRVGGPFGAIIGNPPYIRHHLLPDDQAQRGRESARRLGVDLNGRSDAWAYFCAHLVSFLGETGRLALVLPGSVLQADYAVPLLEALAADKGEVQLIRIGERLFPKAQERTVVLLIDRTKAGTGRTRMRQRAGVSSLRQALKQEPQLRPRRLQGGKGRKEDTALATPRKEPAEHVGSAPWGLTKAEAELYETVRAHESVLQLGDLIEIRIGVVTGANDFFVLSKREITALGDDVQSKPIVSRGGWLRGARWGAADQKRVANKGSYLLLVGADDNLSPLLRSKIDKAEHQGLHLRHHCSKRDPWYAIGDAASPQMFLPYMGSRPPRIVVNDAKATCTNAVHRLRMKPGVRCSTSRVAAASWSTLYALSAELSGKSYGGGVLKLEPGRTTKMAAALPPSGELLEEIALHVKKDGIDAGCKLADKRLLIDGLGLSTKELSMLQAATRRLGELR